MIKLLLIIITFFNLITSTSAGNPKIAYEALISGDYDTAYKEYKSCAEKENALCQYMFGTMYLYGEGTAQNSNEAYKWIKLSSDHFRNLEYKDLNENEKLILPHLYFDRGYADYFGDGTSKDLKNAFVWLKMSADLGNVEAASMTARNYYLGHGISKNLDNFFKYLLFAGENGSPKDYLELARAYNIGEAVERNFEEAFMWANKAANYDFAENYKIPESYIVLALHYKLGVGTDQNYKKAFKWFKRSAERGNIDAFVHLAYAYGAGEGTKKNMKLSFKWYKKAADEKIQEAYYPLAYLYANGEGTKKDEKKADELIFMLAELGDEAAKRIIEDAIKQANYENNIKDKEKLSICNAEFDTFDPKEHDCITSLENLHASYVSYYRDLKGGNIEKNHCSKFSAKNDTPKRIEYCFELLKGNIELNLELQRKKEIIRAYYDELEAQRRAEVRQQSINNLINIGISLLGGGSSSYHSNPYVPSTNSFEDKRMQCTRTHDTFFTCRPHMSLGERTNCVIGNRTCQNGMSFGYNGNNLFIGGQSGSKNACRNAPNGTFMCN